MITRVVNMRTDEYDVRIDRATMWGNPFYLRDESERTQVISDYRRWLWTQIQNGEITVEQLAELNGKRLGCWCAPKPCHGDVLKRAAAWAVNVKTTGKEPDGHIRIV